MNDTTSSIRSCTGPKNSPGDRRLHSLRQAAGELHGFYYTRKMLLNDSVVERNLDQVELMLDILQPLTEGA